MIRALTSCFGPALLMAALAICACPAHGQSLEGVLMPGKVIEGHAKLEGECSNCHVLLNKAGQDRLCLDCHKEVAQDVARKQGHHGRIQIPSCRSCHTEHKGRSAGIAPVDERRFDHALTDFQLQGKHTKVECRACHKVAAKFRAASSACVDCHRKDDTHKGTLGGACADCHTEKNWKETTFDHAKTRFPLIGKHTAAKCGDCHKEAAFRQAPQACVSCHRKDDKHKARFGEKCQTCHNAKNWNAIVFDHDTDTSYPLRGRHRQIKCDSCHAGTLYKDKLPSQCIACHRKDDKHKGTLGSVCADCHTEGSWKETRFDHRKTRFPLLGKHTTVECKACHKSTAFKDTPMACVSCHRKDDAHKGTLGDACADCHVERSWKEAKFDHSRTRFALTGKHSSVKCGDCHKATPAKATPQACYACHRQDDKHKGSLGEKCESCHSAQDWKSTRFDHDKDTRYPLRGKHRTAKCESCHTQPAGKVKLPSECNSCHAKDDVHKGQEGPRCATCHQESDWKKTDFDHARSRFPLTGSHLKVECKKCHATSQFKDAKSTCVACHEKEDIHKRRLGSLCDSCHSPRSWKIWDFDHDRKTRFRLDGAHAKLDCYGCHTRPTDGKPSLPTTCVSCHASEDVHDGAFGRQCEKCHVSSSFKVIKQRPGSVEGAAGFCAGPDRIDVARGRCRGTRVSYPIGGSVSGQAASL